MKELCDTGVDLHALVDLKTTVHVSIAFGYEGYLNCLKVLLQAGAPVIATYHRMHPLYEKPMIFNDYENSALRLAAQLGNLEAMELMLQAIKERGDMKEENHVNAIHYALLQAIENKREDIVVLLLKDYNYDRVCTDKTPLTKACECGATNITKVILKSIPRRYINYVPPRDIESETELTALESACRGNHTGCVDLLLKCYVIALLCRQYPKHTKESFDHDLTLRPLTIALKYNSLDCAERLLKHVQSRGIKFSIPTAAHDAVKYGHFDIFKKLMTIAAKMENIDENQNCTDVNQNKLNVKSKNLKNSKTDELIKPPPPVTKVNGLQVEMTSSQKEAINVGLVAAAHYNRVEILKYLLSLGAHVDFVAEMEITQLYDEPEADNVFYDMTGNDPFYFFPDSLGLVQSSSLGEHRLHWQIQDFS